ncbi:MAG TPA: hypothetical protein VF168_07625 [Trueperaceae bacterium]
MSEQGARRFRLDRRRVGIVLAAALALLLILWLVLLLPWPFTTQPASLEVRIDAAVESLADYGARSEAVLRLQFLEAALIDGRRSSELRSDYRLLEEKLEPIIRRMEPQPASALEAELTGLLPDLTRDRSAAAHRLAEMTDLLLPAGGLERQGDRP